MVRVVAEVKSPAARVLNPETTNALCKPIAKPISALSPSFGLPWKVISELVVIPEARPLSKIGLLVGSDPLMPTQNPASPGIRTSGYLGSSGGAEMLGCPVCAGAWLAGCVAGGGLC